MSALLAAMFEASNAEDETRLPLITSIFVCNADTEVSFSNLSTLLPIEVIESVLEFIFTVLSVIFALISSILFVVLLSSVLTVADNVSIYPETSVNTAPDNLLISAVFDAICVVFPLTVCSRMFANEVTDAILVLLVAISAVFLFASEEREVKSSSIFLSILGIVVDEIVCMFVTFSFTIADTDFKSADNVFTLLVSNTLLFDKHFTVPLNVIILAELVFILFSNTLS